MNYANHIGYSDVNPYEVVKVISEKCLEVRAMDATRANPENKLGFVAGGFVGHCPGSIFFCGVVQFPKISCSR